MNFLHADLQLSPDDLVEVTLDHAANVQLLDATNYEEYRLGRPYRYHGGGYAKESPVRLSPPTSGRWHLVVDLGGGTGTVRASYQVLSPQAA